MSVDPDAIPRCPFCRALLTASKASTLDQCGGNDVARAVPLPARELYCDTNLEKCNRGVVVTLATRTES